MTRTFHARSTLLLLSIFFLLTSSIACSLTNFLPDVPVLGGAEDYEDLSTALDAEIVDDRPGVLEYLGPPDAFDISIVEVEDGQVRKESWRYFQYGTRVDFVDGEAIWTIEIDPMPEDTFFAAWYDPLSFKAGMNVSEVSQVIAEASPAEAEPEQISLTQGGEDLADGNMLVGDQIIVGFDQGQLVYVETIALMPEGGE